MNSFLGHIKEINTSGNISIVHVEITPQVALKSIVIDTPETAAYLQERAKVQLLFKEMEVVISLQDTIDISIDNRFSGVILSIDEGVLMSRLVIETEIGKLVAVISSTRLRTLQLVKKAEVTIMVKLNDIILAP